MYQSTTQRAHPTQKQKKVYDQTSEHFIRCTASATPNHPPLPPARFLYPGILPHIQLTPHQNATTVVPMCSITVDERGGVREMGLTKCVGG